MQRNVMTAALAALFLVVGCDAAPTSPDAAEVTPISSNAASHAPAEVFHFPPTMPTLVDGATAKLVRTKNGLTVNVRTAELQPGNAYTLWWIIFDAPAGCAAGRGNCTLFDVFAPGNPADATVFGPAAGSLAGGTGKATFAGHVKPGDEPNFIDLGDGSMDDPLTADVAFVVRNHGPAIPGRIDEQLSTFNGGCPPNNCMNVQFGIFNE